MGRVAEQFSYPRPTDPYYEIRFPFLSQGDIFEDVPYTLVRSEMPQLEEFRDPAAVVLPILPVTAMLLTPTCDFRRPKAQDLLANPGAEPYALEKRVRVAQILPIEDIERTFTPETRSNNMALLRRYDKLRKFMYLPELDGHLPESAVALGPTWLVDLDLLLRCDRLTQLTFVAARQLHYKIVLYETATYFDPTSFNPPMD